VEARRENVTGTSVAVQDAVLEVVVLGLYVVVLVDVVRVVGDSVVVGLEADVDVLVVE
jgi:hypothetical protein